MKTQKAPPPKGAHSNQSVAHSVPRAGTQGNDVVTAATAYVRRDWQVLPIPPGTKAPLIRQWQSLRLIESEIPARFAQGENVGVLLGEPSGWLTDVDLDAPEACAAARYLLPQTGRVFGRVGKPSSHWLYVATKSKTAKWIDPLVADRKSSMLIELRSTGAQTVFPPSVHPSGEVITWEQRGDAAQIAPTDLTRACAKVAAAALLARYWPGEGARQEATMALAGGLARMGWPADEIEAMVQATVEATGDDETRMRLGAARATAEKHAQGAETTGFKRLAELMDERIVKTIRGWLGDKSGERTEAQAREWPEIKPLPPARAFVLPPFDSGILPYNLTPWIVDVADRASVPVEAVAALVMAMVGAAIARRVGIRPSARDSYTVVPNLWGATVMPPGMLKSHILDQALKPLRLLEITERERWETAKLDTMMRAEALQARIAGLKQRIAAAAKKGEDTSTVEASLRDTMDELAGLPTGPKRYIATDATQEKLGEMLVRNPHGLTLEIDELSGWLASMEMESHKADRAFYLKAWNGDSPHAVDRIGRGELWIPCLCLSVIGGIQPARIRRYVEEAVQDGGADGLLARFQLLVWPDEIPPYKEPGAPDRPARDLAHQTVSDLATGDMSKWGAETDPYDTTALPYLRFTADAQNVYNNWRRALETRLRSPEMAETPAFAAHLSKYRSLVPSLALITHLSDGKSSSVGLPALERAIKWVDYLEAHARKLYQAELDDGTSAVHNLAAKIKNGDVTDGMALRDLYHHKWPGLKTSGQVENAARDLESLGWMRIEEERNGERGRYRSVLRINPQLLA